MPTATATAKKKKFFGRFLLLAGSHNEGGRTYKRGDVVDSASDLNQMNAPNAIKFQRVANDFNPTVQEQSNDLGKTSVLPPTATADKAVYDEMSVSELRKVAASEEIDLGEASKKEDIIQLLLINQ